MESDRLYFFRRADEERAAGVVAATVEARQAHIELAWRYHNLALAIEEHEARLSVGTSHDDTPAVGPAQTLG